MQITRNVFNVNDLNQWYETKQLVINKDYQREGGIWVPNARSYLIDTILNNFPFPKITLRQIIDLKTRKTIREIVDGQQRIKTIHSFINDEFSLTSASENFAGLTYSQLDDEHKAIVLGYEISVDLVISATEDEVLEIFRRMNSYTLPLKPAEKRHAIYQGQFKWFIKRVLKKFTPYLLQFKVLTPKTISRMADAELLTEFAQVKIEGITNKSQSRLEHMYKSNNQEFVEEKVIEKEFNDILDFLRVELKEVSESGLLRPYILHSLFAALLYRKYGFPVKPDGEISKFKVTDDFATDVQKANDNILVLLSAFDNKDQNGRYKEFVQACLAATNNSNTRITRTKWFLKALNDDI